MTEREYIINKAKEYGVTSEELGVEPKVEVREVEVKDTQFIHEVSQMIHGMAMESDARENISEKYWKDLAIVPKKKYKILEVMLKKEVYKKVKVAIPEDANESDCNNVDYDYIDNEYLYNEEDWSVDDYETIKDDMTADSIRDKYGSDDIVNIDDFDYE